ncbi:MAG: hypothetical protein VKK98_06025 [Cyanobacteriota bacterium]|nr:hypothetical protein [Cyanobacteriota bacterium]
MAKDKRIRFRLDAAVDTVSGLLAELLSPAPLGSQVTDLLLGRRVLAHLDGSWTASQSNLVLWG